jgi:hypothetical protein
MCQGCDNDMSPDEYFARLRELISRNRFVVQSVLGSRCAAEFSYTIGLTEAGLPELIVLGVRPQDASRLLHCWGDYLLDKSAVLAGETLGSGPWVLEAVEVERPEEHLLIAGDLYGRRVRALQLVWADAAGRFPWDRGHRARRAGQPVLGARAPQFCREHSPTRLDVPPHL